MKILLVTMVRPHQGGIRNHLTSLSQGWRNAGHTVCFCTPLGIFKDFPVRQNAVTGASSVMRKYSFITLIFYWLAKTLLTFRVFFHLLKHSYDIVNVRDVGAFNACSLICRLFNLPIVLNLHGCLTNDLFSKGLITHGGTIYSYFLKEEKTAYSRSSYLVAVGPQEQENVFNTLPQRKKNIPIIYNVVNTEKFFLNKKKGEEVKINLGIQDNDFTILYVGRLSQRKGVDILIKAFSTFMEKTSVKGKLVIVGTGPEGEPLKNLVKLTTLSKSIIFTGLVPHEDLNGYYNAAHILVIPSIPYRGYTEGTPTSALEGMAAGTPLISTAMGGLGDIVNNRINGLVIKENSVESLVHAMQSLYADQDLRQKLSCAALNYALKIRSIEKVSACWITIFETAIHGGQLTSEDGI